MQTSLDQSDRDVYTAHAPRYIKKYLLTCLFVSLQDNFAHADQSFALGFSASSRPPPLIHLILHSQPHIDYSLILMLVLELMAYAYVEAVKEELLCLCVW